ncbi:MAG: primosomal protein [Mycobacteriaceae bacterium]|nr:primosomal protein [Mycobacteriaceae bacterium]
MAVDLIPLRLSLTAGDRYTLWAPRWRDDGDEWEAFLGKGDHLYGFETVANLVAFVRSDNDHDLADHPAWHELSTANAHALEPDHDQQFDVVAVEELLADKPTEDSVNSLAGVLAIVSSIGSVCELAAVSKFFNGNPSLGMLTGGLDNFTGRAGIKRWNALAEIIERGWDDVLTAIDELVCVPEVDQQLSAQAGEELAEPRPDEDAEQEAETPAADEDATPDTDTEEPVDSDAVLGGDDDFWLQVGIDPIKIMMSSGTFYTLRCYLDDKPIFLGRNGRISVFSSERALARYLADEHDHDLSDLSTYDDIRTAATDGALAIDVAEENIYVLSGLADDLADGPYAVDHEQLDLAAELLRDVGEYAEDKSIAQALETTQPLGKLIASVLDDSDTADADAAPAPAHAEAVRDWERLERFLESRLRRE